MNNMPVHPRLALLLRRLPSPVELLQGSLVRYRTTCWRNTGCRCHRGHKHGPYWYLSTQRRGKTKMVLIHKRKLPRVREYLRNWKRYSSLIRLIMDTHLQLIKKEA